MYQIRADGSGKNNRYTPYPLSLCCGRPSLPQPHRMEGMNVGTDREEIGADRHTLGNGGSSGAIVSSKKKKKRRSSCCSIDGPFVRVCKWTPVLFVAIILSWSYYAYVFQFCSVILPQVYNNNNNNNNNNNGHSRGWLPPVSVAYVVVFNLLFSLLLWSYVAVTYNVVGCAGPNGGLSPKVPARYWLGSEDLADLEKARDENDIGRVLSRVADQLPHLTLATVEGGPRYCDVCKLVKPDRTHHCAACRRCILKMDHHCPWVNNCIQYGNYKQFVLFLFYGLLLCTFAAITTLPYFVSFWSTTPFPSVYASTTRARSHDLVIAQNSQYYPYTTPYGSDLVLQQQRYSDKFRQRGEIGDDGSVINALFSTRFHVLFLFFVAIMFGISMGALLFYHCFLLSRNRTTLESFRAPIFIATGNRPDNNGFDAGGCRANFEQVFGPRILLWPLPIFTAPGDGSYFPTRHQQGSNNHTYPPPDRVAVDHVDSESPDRVSQGGPGALLCQQRSCVLKPSYNDKPSSQNYRYSTNVADVQTGDKDRVAYDKAPGHNLKKSFSPPSSFSSSRTNLLLGQLSPSPAILVAPHHQQLPPKMFGDLKPLTSTLYETETIPIRRPQPMTKVSPYGSFSNSCLQGPHGFEINTPS